MMSSITKAVPVAEFVAQRLKACGRPVDEIASACGWSNSTILELVVQGKTKLPIDKVQSLADALGASAANLLRLVMEEYMPETYRAICETLDGDIVSSFERDALDAVRRMSRNGSNDISISRVDTVLVKA